ncbi:MAG: 50S ribosomal protein L29 [Patescibacteria group bacterium]
MKIEELQKKDKKELEKMVMDLKQKLNDIRFKRSSNQLKNINELSNTRKEIARILTVINQKK